MSSVVTEPPLEEEHDHEQQNPVFSCLRRRKRHAQVRLAAAAKIVPERSDAADNCDSAGYQKKEEMLILRLVNQTWTDYMYRMFTL